VMIAATSSSNIAATRRRLIDTTVP